MLDSTRQRRRSGPRRQRGCRTVRRPPSTPRPACPSSRRGDKARRGHPHAAHVSLADEESESSVTSCGQQTRDSRRQPSPDFISHGGSGVCNFRGRDRKAAQLRLAGQTSSPVHCLAEPSHVLGSPKTHREAVRKRSGHQPAASQPSRQT